MGICLEVKNLIYIYIWVLGIGLCMFSKYGHRSPLTREQTTQTHTMALCICNDEADQACSSLKVSQVGV